METIREHDVVMEVILPEHATLLDTTNQVHDMVTPLICTPLNGTTAGISICNKEHPCSPLIDMDIIPTLAQLGRHHQVAVKLFLFVFGKKFYTTTPHYALFEINLNNFAKAMNSTVQLPDRQQPQFF